MILCEVNTRHFYILAASNTTLYVERVYRCRRARLGLYYSGIQYTSPYCTQQQLLHNIPTVLLYIYIYIYCLYTYSFDSADRAREPHTHARIRYRVLIAVPVNNIIFSPDNVTEIRSWKIAIAHIVCTCVCVCGITLYAV
jgi:hypothetical protein